MREKMTKDNLFELLFSSDIKAQEKALKLIDEEIKHEKPSVDIPALVTFSFARPYLEYREIVYDRIDALQRENRYQYGDIDNFESLIYELTPICEKGRLLLECLPKRPKKLDYRTNLEYIKYVCEKGDSRTITKLIELTSFDDGESLCWHGTRINELPNEFLSFPKLKHVELHTAFFKSFPSVLTELTQLEEINIYSSKITSIPKEIKRLKNLKKISIVRNLIDSIPDELGGLSGLEEIDFTKNRLTELPVSMAQLKNLKSITLASNPMISAVQVQKLFALFYKNSTPLLTREVWLHLIFSRIEKAIELDSIVDIISALNTKLSLLKDNAMLALDRVSELALKSNPLSKGSIIGVCGNIDEFESIQEKLLERDIELTKGLVDQCTHILLGELSVFDSLPKVTIITHKLLRVFLQGDEVPLFLDEAEDSANAREKLNELLSSDDERNQLLAFEMLKSLGISQDVVANLYYLFRVTSNKKIRATAKSLLLQNASPTFMQIINKSQSYTNCSEPGFIRHLNDLKVVNDLDIIYFAKLIYKKMEYGINFLFDTKDPEAITYAIRTNIENHGYLSLRYSHLSYLPEELGQFVDLYKIDLDGNKIKKLPESMGNLIKLEAIHLSDNMISKLPNSFSNLKNISYIDLSINSLRKCPVELLALPNLRELYLFANNIKSWPKDMGCLNKLTHLNYGSTNATEIPPCFFTLRSLVSLKVHSVNIKGVTKEICQLAGLKCLKLISCNLRQFPLAICELDNLEELSLERNNIQEYPKEICSLTKLKRLNIGSNKLKTFPENITSIGSLEVLDLLHNDIENFPKSLSKLESLKNIEIGGYSDNSREIRKKVTALVPKGCKVD